MLYRLGNEQWNIPGLTELLETVLPQHRLVKNFSVTHDFPEIGKKTMLVSGRRIEEAYSGQRAPLAGAKEALKRGDPIRRQIGVNFSPAPMAR